MENQKYELCEKTKLGLGAALVGVVIGFGLYAYISNKNKKRLKK